MNTRLAPAEIAYQIGHAEARLLLHDAGFEGVAPLVRRAAGPCACWCWATTACPTWRARPTRCRTRALRPRS